jgi:voltage-gated potassium channel
VYLEEKRGSMVSKIYHSVYRFFATPYMSLLIFLMLLLLFRPHYAHPVLVAGWELCFAAAFIAAVFNCNHARNTKAAAIVLGAVALIMEWVSITFPTLAIVSISIVLTVIFILVCTISVISHDIIKAPPKLSSIRPIVCAYLMIGYIFGYIYLFIELISPGSLRLAAEDASSSFFRSRYLSDAIYFSFGSMLGGMTGDIVPLISASQSMTLIQAIVGQFYIGVLTSRLVSVFIKKSWLENLVKPKPKP